MYNILKQLPKVITSSVTASDVTDQCDCPGDCACTLASGDIDPSSPNAHLTTETWLSQGPEFQSFGLDSEYSVYLASLYAPVVLNRAAEFLLSFFQSPQPLENLPVAWLESWGWDNTVSALVQMQKSGLVTTKQEFSNLLDRQPSILTVWLHVTDRCNLRCEYCYLPHHPLDMSLETGKAALEATFRSALTHNFAEVKIKYAGGESLLRFPFVVALHQYAQVLANQYNLCLDGVILTNGTLLTTEIIRTMQDLKLRLMISLDGLGEVHDRQRFYANKRDSYEDVRRSIELALNFGLVPDISITVSGRNVEELPNLIGWILERNLPFSLNFYRENNFSASNEDLKLEEQKMISGMLAAFQVIAAQIPRRNLLASLVDRANLAVSHRHTCGVGKSYLVFNHLGQVSKCQMAISNPVTTAKAKDPLNLIRLDAHGIQNLSVEEKEGCRGCEWKYWCTGGCPLATNRATGRYDVKSSNCNIYKALYPEAVRLEGLRLLKYENS